MSWAVWGVLTGVMTISAYMSGVRASTLLSFASCIACLMIVVLGWRQGKLRITKLDVGCLLGACAGIAALVVLRNPTMALEVSVAVNVIAFAPTVRHSIQAPNEESLICYICAVVAAAVLFGVSVYSHAGFVGMVYPFASMTCNGGIAVLLIAGRLVARHRATADVVE